MAVGGALKRTLLVSLESVLARQPGGPAVPNPLAFILQFAGHTRVAVGPMRAGKRRADVGQQNPVLTLTAATFLLSEKAAAFFRIFRS